MRLLCGARCHWDLFFYHHVKCWTDLESEFKASDQVVCLTHTRAFSVSVFNAWNLFLGQAQTLWTTTIQQDRWCPGVKRLLGGYFVLLTPFNHVVYGKWIFFNSQWSLSFFNFEENVFRLHSGHFKVEIIWLGNCIWRIMHKMSLASNSFKLQVHGKH